MLTLGRRPLLAAAGALAVALPVTAAAQTEPITIGVIANLTGSDVASSIQMTRGVELGVDAINAAGGIDGRPIALIVEDSEYRTEAALSAATKLYQVDDVSAAIMFGGSSLMLAVAEIVKDEGGVLINTSSSSPQLGDFPGTLFSILPLDDIVGKSLGDWMLARGVTSAAFVVPNNTFGTGLMESTAAAFEAGGGTVVAKIAYTEGQPDYRADLQPLVAAAPEAIFVGGYGDDSRTVFRNARELGLEQTWYGAYPSILTVEDPDWMNGKLLGVDNGGTTGPVAQEVAAAYAAKWSDTEPTPHVFYGYDAVQVLARAIAAVGTDPAAIAAALPDAVEGYEGATGTITWDDRGQRIDPPMDIVEYSDGAFITTGPVE